MGLLRNSVWRKSRGFCALCGMPMDRRNKRSSRYFTVDHIVPLSKGGSSDISNLQGACRPCNERKGARMPRG